MRLRQIYMPGFETPKMVHGGEHSVGRRKCARPISTKKPIHVVLRSSKAKGKLSLRGSGNFQVSTRLLKRYSTMFNIKVYQYSINSNHIHIVIRTLTRFGFQNFLRALAGNLAVKILGAHGEKGKFWDLLAFSRVAEWGSAFKSLIAYVIQNQLETAGAVAYKERKKKFKTVFVSKRIKEHPA